MGRHPMFTDWKINVVNVVILSKLICRFSTIPIKIPDVLFAEVEKLTLKFIWRWKECRIAKTNWQKKNKTGGFPLPDFKLI